MTDASELATLRALRTEAWSLVRKDIEDLREGLAARPIGQRIKDRAVDEVGEAINMARDVATENKTVIGLTLAALAGWFMRAPIAHVAEDIAAAVTRWFDRR